MQLNEYSRDNENDNSLIRFFIIKFFLLNNNRIMYYAIKYDIIAKVIFYDSCIYNCRLSNKNSKLPYNII